MSDFLKSGLQWLSNTLAASASQTVTYRRGDQQVSVTATFGHKLLKVADGKGSWKLIRADRDFCFPWLQLDFGAGPAIPLIGDTIDVAEDDGTSTRWQVAPPAPREPHFQLDRYRIEIRVHAKWLENL